MFGRYTTVSVSVLHLSFTPIRLRSATAYQSYSRHNIRHIAYHDAPAAIRQTDAETLGSDQGRTQKPTQHIRNTSHKTQFDNGSAAREEH